MTNTTTPAPKGADIERYRAGFEAAARRITHVKDFIRADEDDGYRDYVLNTYWLFWKESKREASTEPSSTSTSQGAEPAAWRERAAKACENERVDDSTETEGDIAYNKAIDHCKRAIMELDDESDGAAPVDALDAARYRIIRGGATGNDALTAATLFITSTELDEITDRAIAASTAQGKEE